MSTADVESARLLYKQTLSDTTIWGTCRWLSLPLISFVTQQYLSCPKDEIEQCSFRNIAVYQVKEPSACSIQRGRKAVLSVLTLHSMSIAHSIFQGSHILWEIALMRRQKPNVIVALGCAERCSQHSPWLRWRNRVCTCRTALKYTRSVFIEVGRCPWSPGAVYSSLTGR